MNFDRFVQKFRELAEADQDNLNVSIYKDMDGYLRIVEGPMLYCPITYVTKRETGKEYPIEEAPKAGKDLGIDDYVIWPIIYASDGEIMEGFEYESERTQLLQAVGLFNT